MNNIVILPIIIPMILGLIMVIFRRRIMLHRVLSILSMTGTGGAAAYLIYQVKHEGIQTLQLGGWEAPFGVSMVVDMLSALLLITTSIVALFCVIYAFKSIGREREEHYFYPLFLFLITGVNGSFITGDVFNLFVCFEVMLISSYALITLGGKSIQLRESIKYVLVNIIASFLFLIAIAYLYAVTGTLNMAHLSERVAEVGQGGLMTAVAIIFLFVFSLKAGLFLFFWLPGSYSAPPTAVAAVFAALLTKVGIYAIYRFFTLVFYHEPQVTHLIIGIMAAVTMVLGAMGAIAYKDIKKILTYNVVVGVGFILAGLASFTDAGMTGSIYYLMHDMVIKALIFIIGGVIIAIAGTSNLDDMSGLIQTHPYLGWMFFITALSISGIPPLSGFIGKVYITEGTFTSGYYWLGAIGLITSLMVLFSVMKIFMNSFWGETILSEEMEKGTTRGVMFPIVALVMLTIGLGLGAELLHDYVEIAVEGLMNPSLYIEAVLGGNAQ
ncbi:multicomponent Na+:H+ antiporter subunit D [Cytobacillus horneckiae]|uniref:Na+/H+ antiporter subunit D n=1 Tax=Cytobacillus horneckiae TaxID=549687 RepID=A0A2N0ZAU7_9BACI|nr:Na+/H+ antiporter subunit D [Cytobacillus horneckiae]MBN6887844.1 Na+/H+ antiporter subunit D [Cytobacillus horneckiae]MCM3179800.1 Na+/H+ antiporter subunit D [Cytobacillus horneckiae]MEC1155187.1 Na+/H+ antiporter subunit D [Cytobacillus horneckiae]MED2936760.1 Na+/H+ antiporter subunit D [Cytobacillus horneckiae]PKG26632.1 Na+/H+ antiporter subunit D [Cytobacillus horneckiae]